ncbi:MAG: thiamine phosphate synthase [Actinobacteria bacterium]|nr:thiamine phosphate synthase [Actinomycetota bacterium]
MFKRQVAYDLYFVSADIELLGRGHLDTIAAAITGGATVVQLRDKSGTKEAVCERARTALVIARSAGVPLIINDQVDVALEIQADGVHIGQSDLPLKKARLELGPDLLVGVSVSTVEEARLAQAKGADYLGVGPIFPTTSKHDSLPPIGLQGLAKIRDAVNLPLVAIGGIDTARVASAIEAGADGVAVISAIAEAEDMVAAASEMRRIIEREKRKAPQRREHGYAD